MSYEQCAYILNSNYSPGSSLLYRLGGSHAQKSQGVGRREPAARHFVPYAPNFLFSNICAVGKICHAWFWFRHKSSRGQLTWTAWRCVSTVAKLRKFFSEVFTSWARVEKHERVWRVCVNHAGTLRRRRDKDGLDWISPIFCGPSP